MLQLRVIRATDQLCQRTHNHRRCVAHCIEVRCQELHATVMFTRRVSKQNYETLPSLNVRQLKSKYACTRQRRGIDATQLPSGSNDRAYFP